MASNRKAPAWLRGSVRVRGYRIRYQVEGQDWMKSQIGVLWQPEPHLPPEWEATKQNPRVIQALLIRSGKKFDRYQRH